MDLRESGNVYMNFAIIHMEFDKKQKKSVFNSSLRNEAADEHRGAMKTHEVAWDTSILGTAWPDLVAPLDRPRKAHQPL
jgi:hypothetical protein